MAGHGVVLKLEREASLGGSLATAGSGEIEIPPPRPKRKPSHPYPKKASGAFSSSPSFEEDSMSPPAVHSAFTPLESSTGTTVSKMPPKKIGASAASLRLFGQNVVPGSDKVEADTDLMESTGSPRSQISVGTEETSGVSPPVSNTASGVWDQTTSVLKPNEAASTLSGTESHLCNAIAEWDKSLTAVHSGPEGSCFTPWQPSSFPLEGHFLTQVSASVVPAFWQGLVPPSFSHGMNEDVNTAAAIAAATYALASAWQAIQEAATNGTNHFNTSIVYSPIAMLAASRNPVSVSRPQSLHAHVHEHPKREWRGYPGSGNGDEGTSLHGEESTAECCSSLTDTSRLTSYESNDEGVPVKKQRRSFHEDNMQLDSEALQYLEILKRERSSKADGPSFSSEGYATLDESSHESPHGNLAIHSKSTDDRIDEPSDKARTEKSSVNELLQPERDLHTANIVSGNVSMVPDQPLDLIIQACRLDSHFETEEGSSKGKEAPKESQEIVSSSTVSQSEENKASILTECTNRSLHREWIDSNRLQIGVNGTCIESGEHLSAGATVSSRYSGAGFVPYKKSI